MRTVALIAHDIRSTHNVGSILRTAECLGIDIVYLTGYTPYPHWRGDTRLPHIAAKLNEQIHKPALGTEAMVAWEHEEDVTELIRQLKKDGFAITALEQTATSTALPDWRVADKVAILLGREVEGIEPALLELCDRVIEIPQFGEKESLNVVQAAAIALYWARFAPQV